MEIFGLLERVLRDAGESYLGFSKVVVMSIIVGDKKTNGGFDNEENHSCINFVAINVIKYWEC